MPTIEATLCYVEQGDSVLMIRRGKQPGDLHAGKYNGLGGKLEPGESPLDCARRELLEESGLRADRLSFAGHIVFPRFDGSNDWSVFLFRAADCDGALLEDSREGVLEWIPRDRLLDSCYIPGVPPEDARRGIPLWEGDRHFLPWVLSGRRFLARFDYESGRYVDHAVEFIDQT